MLWWVGTAPHEPSTAVAGMNGTEVALDAGLAGAPRETTVRAALLTGRSPREASGGVHRSGRPTRELADFIARHSVLAAWARAGLRVRPATAEPPDAFRGPPRVEMLAYPVGAPTVGDVRRGQALAADLSGRELRRRGHGQVPLLEAGDVVERLAAWWRSSDCLFLRTDGHLDPDLADAVLGGLIVQGVPLVWVGLPPDWPAHTAWVGSTIPGVRDVKRIEEIAPWMGGRLEAYRRKDGQDG